MKTPALLAALLICSIASADDTASLKHTPKKGEVLHLKLTSTSTTNMGDSEVLGSIVATVIDVAGDGGYSVEQSIDLKITFPGGEIPIKGTSTSVYDSNDMLTDVKGEGVDAGVKEGQIRDAALRSFHSPEKPVKVGDSWTFTQAAGSTNGDTGTKVEYKVEAAEEVNGHKVFKVHASGKQSGSSDGTIEADDWIDRTTGLTVKSVGTLKHVELSPGIVGDSKFTLVLVE